MMLYCDTCGSRHVQISAWIYANNWADMKDGDVVGSGSEGPSGSTWCDNCENPDGGTVYDRREAAAARLRYRREHGPDAGVVQSELAADIPCVCCGRIGIPLHPNHRCGHCGIEPTPGIVPPDRFGLVLR